MTAPYRFENRGRSRRAVLTLGGIWAALLAGMALIDLAPWIAAVLFVFTLPAFWEFVTNARATLDLSDEALEWHSARFNDRVPLTRIDKVRLDTRLDLSVRITLILTDMRRIRLPHACVPPHQRFEDELQARGVKTERHHFSLIG